MESGKISESVLKRSVLRQIKSKNELVENGAAVGADCAIFNVVDKDRVVSCVQEGVLLLSEKDRQQDPFAAMTMESLAQKCINNLVISGAKPFAVMPAFLLPLDFQEQDLKELMKQTEEFAKGRGLQIAGGQTFLTGAVKAPVATITGFGTLCESTGAGLKGIKPGQDVVITKWIGLEGTAYLAQKYEKDLATRYPLYLIEDAEEFEKLLSVEKEALAAIESGVCGIHDISKGGVFGALWEMAEGAGVGLRIDLKKLPLRQETVEICEFCNVNPYELLSGGALLMTCENGDSFVDALLQQGIPAVVVGRTTDTKERVLINEDEVRYMDRPKKDALYGKVGDEI